MTWILCSGVSGATVDASGADPPLTVSSTGIDIVKGGLKRCMFLKLLKLKMENICLSII